MTFDSVAVIGQLQDLEQQIVATSQCAALLQRAFVRGDRADVLCNLVHSERHLRTMATTTTWIREGRVRSSSRRSCSVQPPITNR